MRLVGHLYPGTIGRPIVRKHLLRVISGIVLTCIFAGLYMLQPHILSNLDLEIYDAMLRMREERPSSGNVVIIDIDTKSLSAYGQWPWPRYRMAELMDRLREMGAASVGVDILFAERDRTSAAGMPAAQRRTDGHAGFPVMEGDNDAVMADALRRGPYVLGYQFLFGEAAETDCGLRSVDVLVRRDDSVRDAESGLFRPTSADCLYHTLAEAAPALGFLNIRPDKDGIIRRVPLLVEFKGRYFAHMSLAVLLSALKQEQMVLNVGNTGTESLSLSGIEIPLEQKGTFLIPFNSRNGAYRHISASDIFSGRTPASDMSGRVAIVGVTAPGLLDIHATPTDPSMPGVEVLANIADAIIQRDFIVRPKTAPIWELSAIMFLGLLSTILFAGRRPVGNLILLFFFPLAAAGIAFVLFRKGILISPLYPALMSVSNYSLLSAVEFIRKERMLKEKTRLQLATQEAMLESIANITEARDQETGGHIRRTCSYVKALAERIRTYPAYAGVVNDKYIEHLCQSAPLHDVGKVGVPDQILLKPGCLSAEEFEEIKKHTHYGKKVIDAARSKLGSDSFLTLAGEMAFSHHERWDGNGYPNGLKGADIPLSGRIMAIADAYDAMISGRKYRPALSHEKAVEIIIASKGSQFDPDLVDAFGDMHATFNDIARKFADGNGIAELGECKASAW